MIQIQKEVFKKIEIKIYSDSGGGIQEHQKFRFIYSDSDLEESIQGGRNSDLSSVTVIQIQKEVFKDIEIQISLP